MERYSELVMEHFMHPRNVGVIEDADGVGVEGNPICGDMMEMFIKVRPEDEVIEDIKFRTFGCGAAIATSSIATEMIKGKTIEEALALTNKAIAEALGGLPPIKIHCSVLAADALKAAVADYRQKQAAKAQGSSDSESLEEESSRRLA
jgi:nitrogen fixation NifU-like protein